MIRQVHDFTFPLEIPCILECVVLKLLCRSKVFGCNDAEDNPQNSVAGMSHGYHLGRNRIRNTERKGLQRVREMLDAHFIYCSLSSIGPLALNLAHKVNT